MRIGIDCRLWNETGVGRYIRNLVTHLQEIDTKNEYVLFVLEKDKEFIKSQMVRQAHHPEQSRRIHSKFRIVEANVRWHTLAEQVEFNTILKKVNLDLVHFPYFSVPILYNRPFIITIHDLILHHFPTGEASHLPYALYRLKLEAYKFIIQQAASKAQKIITVSEATRKEIVDHLHVSQDKVVVTYEGASENVKLTMQNAKLQFKISNYFLHVGNVYPHKNVNRLIEAFDAFINQDPKHRDVQLVLVGKEDYFFTRLRQKVLSGGLKEHVVFLGSVSDEALSGLYKNAIATVVPSLMEGFGLPAVEAMENNCLVIASDISSLREVCGDAAIYCDPSDISDIAEKLTKVYSMPESDRDTLRQEGKSFVAKYSWKHMAQQTLTVYEDSLGVRSDQ